MRFTLQAVRLEDDQHRSLVAGEMAALVIEHGYALGRDAGASILRDPERWGRGGRTNYTAL
jgi:hypothetical protein